MEPTNLHISVQQKIDETSAFTKFLKQNAETARTIPRFPHEESESAEPKFSKDHKSPFCIESLLKSESRADRYPSPPSSDTSPPPPFSSMPMPQFPFPPGLLPYLLPGPQTPDYVHMEYLARQGVFLNSFPAFAGTVGFQIFLNFLFHIFKTKRSKHYLAATRKKRFWPFLNL